MNTSNSPERRNLLRKAHESEKGKTQFFEFLAPAAIGMILALEASQRGTSAIIMEPNLKAPMAPKEGFAPVDVLVGLSSCGKDYLAEQLNQNGLTRQTLGFGEMLSKRMQIDRDKLKHENPIKMEDHYPGIVEDIINQSPCFVTSHPVFRQGDTWAFVPDIYNAMRPRNFILVISHPDDIIRWSQEREKKTNRPAHTISAQRIDSRQMFIYNTIAGYAAGHGNGLTLVMNRPENLNENLAFLKGVVKKYDKKVGRT